MVLQVLCQSPTTAVLAVDHVVPSSTTLAYIVEGICFGLLLFHKMVAGVNLEFTILEVMGLSSLPRLVPTNLVFITRSNLHVGNKLF